MEKVNLELKGRIALVTGAGRGIGLGIAEAFASRGCAVAVQDIDLSVAECVAKRLSSEGARVVALGGDVADPGFAEQTIPAVLEQLGGLHVLVNNAAIQSSQGWEELAPEAIERQYRANVMTPLRLCQLAMPLFRKQRFGRIINVGSIQQLKGTPSMLAYSMSKAALWNMTTGLAADVAKDGVTVNLIAPGYFDTFRNSAHLNESAARTRISNSIPVGRVGLPRDCAGAALLLASEAGEYITGQRIHIDGGMSLRW
jgi:NAD(P)-dependent dehydrogenase (short-subunit alcohol dehydrogenase family)